MSRLKDKKEKELAFIEDYLDRLEKAESAGNPKARNPMPGQTASGLHQFTAGTWKDVVERHGLEYTLEDRFDPEKSRQVATLHTLDNKRYLEKFLNREVNMTDLYVIHFLGVGRGKEFLQALEKDPYMSVGTILNDSEIRYNPSYVRQKEDSSRKHTGRLNVLAETYNKLSQRLGQEPRDFFNEIVERDTNIYGVDANGNYVTLNPNFVTEQDIQNSKIIKTQFYKEYLTNLQSLEETPIFTPQEDTFFVSNNEDVVPVQNITNNYYYESNDSEQPEEKPNEVTEAKKKLNERQFLVDLINSGALNLQNPEYNITPQMYRGGQIPTSSQGLYEYPNQTVKVPTKDGRITMKNISYPVVGISAETGEQILMYPNQEYQFKNTKNVIEIPLSQYGIE